MFIKSAQQWNHFLGSESVISRGIGLSLRLWELLIEIEKSEDDHSLTCSQCFAILEIIGSAIDLEIDPNRLANLARQQMVRCPGCREMLLAQLERLENLANSKTRSSK